MENCIYNERFSELPPVDRGEVLRYARMRTPTAEVSALLDEVLGEVLPIVEGKVCYRVLPVSKTDGGITLGPADVSSENLKTALGDCPFAVLFAATIGFGTDRLITKYNRLSPAKALLIEAVGNERVEAVCDLFQSKFADARPRFSPGYGDLPLDFQRQVFALLECPKNIGVTLNDSLLMTPVKSVTALFGIREWE